MQGGEKTGYRLLEGAAALAGIDSRPLMLAFSVCGGAALYFSLPFEPASSEVLAATLAAFVLWLAARRWWTSDIAITIVVCALGVCLGTAAATLRARSVAQPVISATTGPAMVEGWVQDVEPGRKGVRLLIRVHSVSGMAPEDWPKHVRLTHTSRLEVAPGRFVRCWSVLRPPPAPAMPGEYDFRRQSWFAQLGAVGYVQGRCRGGALGAPSSLDVQANLQLGAARRNLAEHVVAASGERAGGFAAALVSGDRSFMSEEDTEALRASGLSHIISISGLHLSILGGVVFLLVKRTLVFFEPIALRVAVQKPAAIVATLACLAYMIISGSAVETQRSFVMAAIVFGAIIFDRAAISLRTFAIAMIAVVLLQPESVVTPGFQMSFAATGALIAAFEAWRNRRAGEESVMGPIAYSWVSVVVTSVVAGLATMPYAVFHFDRASPIGFLANLAATPVVTFLSAPSAAMAFLLAPFGQSDLGLRLFGYSLELVLGIAHFFAQFSADPVPATRTMPASSMIASTLALAALISTRGYARFILGGALVVPAILFWINAPRLVAHWSSSGDLFLAAPEGGITRIALTKGDGLAPLRYADLPATHCEGVSCRYALPDGISVHVTTGDAAAVCFLAASDASSAAAETCAPDPSQPHLYWTARSATAHNGLTLYSVEGNLELHAPTQCGRRPWHPCQPEYGVD